MGLQDDLRAQLIKQFPAEVIELAEQTGQRYYACPSCKRPVAKSDKACPGCQQALGWDKIRASEAGPLGPRYAVIKFEIPGDFAKGDCRKCPLSYITKSASGNVYECPLNLRTNCPIQVEKK